MKSIATTIGMCALLAAATSIRADEQSSSSGKPGFKSEETQIIRATVQKVDQDKREVTIKRSDGEIDTVKVSDAVRNLDQIKPGDIVTAKYTESIAISVRKSDEPPSATGRETTTRAPKGESPSGKHTSTMQITATIEKINHDTREMTLLGPEGNLRTIKVPEEVKRFDELKKGDQVVVTATQSIAVDVTTPQK